MYVYKVIAVQLPALRRSPSLPQVLKLIVSYTTERVANDSMEDYCIIMAKETVVEDSKGPENLSW